MYITKERKTPVLLRVLNDLERQIIKYLDTGWDDLPRALEARIRAATTLEPDADFSLSSLIWHLRWLDPVDGTAGDPGGRWLHCTPWEAHVVNWLVTHWRAERMWDADQVEANWSSAWEHPPERVEQARLAILARWESRIGGQREQG